MNTNRNDAKSRTVLPGLPSSRKESITLFVLGPCDSNSRYPRGEGLRFVSSVKRAGSELGSTVACR